MLNPRLIFSLQIFLFVFLTFTQLFRLEMTPSQEMGPIQQALVHPNQKLPKKKLMEKPPENSFGGCLIWMDDNHYLNEWLAFHYHTLPLRRLIVGIDPRSETTPTEILDRYRHRGLMKITEWREEDFMPPHLIGMHHHVQESNAEGLKELYINRQSQFMLRCMAWLKHENMTWTAMTDVDEYILPNPFADKQYRVENAENRTIYELIESNKKLHPMIKRGCISMHRLQFGIKESNALEVQSMTPPGYNSSDFITFRFRYHAGLTNKKFNKIAKCMIDLSKVSEDRFIPNEINAHMPIKSKCSSAYLRIPNSESPFVAYHYTGTWKQWNYRNDFRPKKKRENFDTLYFDNDRDDTIRPWLNDFVNKNGKELARALLKGAGIVPPKNNELD
jgi:hypothetical protein